MGDAAFYLALPLCVGFAFWLLSSGWSRLLQGRAITEKTRTNHNVMLSALIVALYLFEAAIWMYAHLLKKGNDPAFCYKMLGVMLVAIAVVMVGVVALAAKVFVPKRT